MVDQIIHPKCLNILTEHFYHKNFTINFIFTAHGKEIIEKCMSSKMLQLLSFSVIFVWNLSLLPTWWQKTNEKRFRWLPNVQPSDQTRTWVSSTNHDLFHVRPFEVILKSKVRSSMSVEGGKILLFVGIAIRLKKKHVDNSSSKRLKIRICSNKV